MTTGYGCVCYLAPELAAKIREAFASFDWEGTTREVDAPMLRLRGVVRRCRTGDRDPSTSSA